ncbi:hypothetical protein ACLHDF_30270 [Priestia aryabhattai]|uniref:hypothetical protein n=1 Tax=Priestia megaterium TaxID=1404 RepID=UPI0039B85923
MIEALHTNKQVYLTYYKQGHYITEAGIIYLSGDTFMYNFRVYTLRDGSKRIIKLKERESFKEELQRAGIQETQIFQMQLMEKPE